MAEARHDQPSIPGESSGESFREMKQRELAAERGSESSADRQDQPSTDDLDRRGQTTDELDRESEADQLDDGELDQESDLEPEDDQPDDDDAPRVFNVDGTDYSDGDVRELVEARSKYDSEFRRRTQIIAKQKREFDVAGQQVGQMANFFLNLANSNVEQYERFDSSNLTGEQLRTFQQKKQEAERGRVTMMGQIGKMRDQVTEQEAKFTKQQVEESRSMLGSIEPRWNDAFYSDVRTFALDSGRYSAEEFEKLTDWRQMEGLISLMDRDGITRRTEVNREPKRPKRRRERARARRRNAGGKFESNRNAVLKSTNATKDGSFREMMKSNLARENR